MQTSSLKHHGQKTKQHQQMLKCANCIGSTLLREIWVEVNRILNTSIQASDIIFSGTLNRKLKVENTHNRRKRYFHIFFLYLNGAPTQWYASECEIILRVWDLKEPTEFGHITNRFEQTFNRMYHARIENCTFFWWMVHFLLWNNSTQKHTYKEQIALDILPYDLSRM